MTPHSSPRIAIAGAGVVGCFVGGHLARHAEVTLIGRDRVLDPIRREGLTIRSWRTEPFHIASTELRLSAAASAARGADYVLFTTKNSGTAALARALTPHLREDTILVGLQNGLHGADIVRDNVGAQLVVAGTVPFNVACVAPATYAQASSGTILVDAHPRLRRLVQAFSASALAIRTSRDMQAVLHGKMLMNLNNAVQGLSGLPLREELSDRHLRTCAALCVAEGYRVFTAAGVIPKVPLGVPAWVMPHIMRLPTPIYKVLARTSLTVDDDAVSSLGDDLRSGRPTEIDELQGEVVTMGRRVGVPTPACERIVELVHQAERDGPQRRRWSGPSLVAELRAARAAARI